MFLFVALKGGSKILDIFLKAFAIKGVGQVFLDLKTLSSCLFRILMEMCVCLGGGGGGGVGHLCLMAKVLNLLHFFYYFPKYECKNSAPKKRT